MSLPGDIKTVMATKTLLGFSRMLAEELPTLAMEEIQLIAASMRTSSTNYYRLLENLLEWSHMQRGATSFAPESFLLMPKMEESLQLVLESATKKKIRIRYDIAEDLTVLADRNMLGSTIRNLATNAVKFTPKGGEFIIAAKQRAGNAVEISIRDTGIGMSKDMLDKLFFLDDQKSSRGTGGEAGSGLGLIICRDFIEKHGGNICVENEVGKGSTFYFTIPQNGRK
jgi:signal transduction histidine kinase